MFDAMLRPRHGYRFSVISAVPGFFLLAALVLSGCSSSIFGSDPTVKAPATTTAPPTETPAPPPPDVSFTIIGAGDILTHTLVLNAASQHNRTDYEFSRLLEPIDAWVSGADLALCHLELPTHLAGGVPQDYPIFGSPPVLIPQLQEQGWDGCSTASNHSLDQKYVGLAETLDNLDEVGMGHVGTARSEVEYAAPQFYKLTREGRTVTIAHISAAYGTNGLPIPKDKPWSIQLLDSEIIIARAREARKSGADMVIASIHAGTEYVTEPNIDQVTMAKALASSGEIDLYLGHHAHVPQPVTKLPGGPENQGMWTYYGVGNLLSNQSAECCSPSTQQGALAVIRVTIPADGSAAKITQAGWTPTMVDRAGGYYVYPLATLDLANPPPELSLSKELIAERLALIKSEIGNEAEYLTVPPTPTGEPPEVIKRPALP